MKTTQEQLNKGQDIYNKIIAKAWDDNNFKNELLSDPKIAIEKFTGKNSHFPDNTSIVVEDQSDSSVIYLNIPRQINLDDFELTEEQLELASGGIIGLCILVCVGCAAAGFGTAALLDKYF